MTRFKIQNKYVIVDAEYAPFLKTIKWYICEQGYARATISGKVIYMHELIINRPPSKVIDHINFNKLDNTKINLQILSNIDNLNKRQFKRKGVGFHYASNKWRARVRVKGTEIYLGIFKTKKQAIKAVKDFYDNIN